MVKPNGSGFNCSFPGIDSGHPFSLASWNANGLFHNNHSIRQRKLAHLLRVVSKHTLTFVYETHASEADVAFVLHRYSRQFEVFFRRSSILMAMHPLPLVVSWSLFTNRVSLVGLLTSSSL